MNASVLSPIKRSAISGATFFFTVLGLSYAFAALNTGLSTSDQVGSGATLSSTAWNKIVNSVVELDTRTAAVSSSGGNVGIGTASPVQKLEVQGKIQATEAFRGSDMFAVYGNVCGSGTIATGGTGGNGNLNSCAGNGRTMITVCSAHTGSYAGKHVFRAFVQAHGNLWNVFGTDLANYVTDGALSVTTAGGNCTFTNNTGENVKWVIKQLPLTAFSTTVAGY